MKLFESEARFLVNLFSYFDQGAQLSKLFVESGEIRCQIFLMNFFLHNHIVYPAKHLTFRWSVQKSR
jgi:hypothetical protein